MPQKNPPERDPEAVEREPEQWFRMRTYVPNVQIVAGGPRASLRRPVWAAAITSAMPLSCGNLPAT